MIMKLTITMISIMMIIIISMIIMTITMITKTIVWRWYLCEVCGICHVTSISGPRVATGQFYDKVYHRGWYWGRSVLMYLWMICFFKLYDRCSLYNYADDNTISISHFDTNELMRQLQYCTEMAIQWFESNQMQVNTSKFQFMVMYAGLNPGSIELTIGNQVIQSVECVKLLGIHSKLSFDKHISTLWQRTPQKCTALNGVTKFLSKESKECLFNAIILSNFTYGNLVWHLCSKKNSLEIEKINRKALRIVVNDYTLSYADIFSTTKLCPLHVSRLKSMATDMFKSMSHNCPTFIENFFTMPDTPYDLRGGKSMIQPSVETTTFGLKSFRYGSQIVEQPSITNEMCIEPKRL